MALRILERLPRGARTRIRRWLGGGGRFLVVTGGPQLIRGALAGYPRAIRELCAGAHIRRHADSAGGGFWPDSNDIWLAAGVETFESHRQVFRSACHELFHYVCWNHPVYKEDLERGFPAMLAAVREAQPLLGGFPAYNAWIKSFLTQGDHANPVEYFADIPTNFRGTKELPPPLAAYFGALIDGTPLPDLRAGRDRPDPPLADFQRLLLPAVG